MKQSRSFSHEPASVTAARRFATQVLSDLSGETAEAIELMVSELATNCVRHTNSGFDLTITQTAREVRIEATDRAGGTPTMRSPKPTDPTGRGLRIIDMLSAGWGVERGTGRGKTVWFTIALSARSRAERGLRD